MSLNLHATVRSAIQSVNADIPAQYLASQGYTPNAAGKQVPAYASAVPVIIQSQPPSSRDLKHAEFLNIQGSIRTVFLYSDPEAIVRVDAKGGDLLQFPQFVGDPVDNWLIVAVPEKWDVGQNGLVTFSGTGSLVAANNQLTIASVFNGALHLGDVIGDSAGAIPANCRIDAFGTGTGGVGTYTMSKNAASLQASDQIVVTDTAGTSGWSKLFVTLQTDRPA